jgi:3-oxoacyl-[acyl-carrier protein] reductase
LTLARHPQLVERQTGRGPCKLGFISGLEWAFMVQSLTGKVALVTGSSSGIGEATVRQLAGRGADVVVHYNSNKDAAETVAADIRGLGVRALVVGGDVSQPQGAEDLVAAVAAEYGRIDMLVNNAGEWHFAPFGEIAMPDVERQFQVSTFSVLSMMQLAAKHFPAEGGAMVNVVSNLAVDPTPGTSIYGAARAAAMAMTSVYARELGPKGITVNAVAAGPTQTKMALVRGTEERRRYVAERTPLGRYGQPDDIANVIVFLATPEGRWVNGQTIIVDGGYTRGF